jgi:hypothetical protein
LLAGVIPALGCSLFPAATGGIAAGYAGVGALHAAMFNTRSTPLTPPLLSSMYFTLNYIKIPLVK